MSSKAGAVLVVIAALAGLAFASVSTFDFVQHLDRQVHDLHCSFVPGLLESDDKSTGCQVTLLSPYSSVMRTSIWGGVPISLAAMSIFALLAYRGLEFFGRPPRERGTAAGITLALMAIPVLASMIMGTIALRELDAVCKLCVGIYVSSGVGLLGAALSFRSARLETAVAVEVDAAGREAGTDDGAGAEPVVARMWLTAAGQAFAFVAVPVVSYATLVPDHGRFIGECGGLIHPEDPQQVMVPLDGNGDTDVIEVFDPLCPACKGLQERLDASGLAARLKRRAVMFPLDSECNWMVSRSLHPGACRVSKAVLCAAHSKSVSVDAVVDWAFEQQSALLKLGEQDLDAVTERVVGKFSALKACLSSPQVEARLNQSLRWTVANKLTVLTPQVFIDGVKLCDEDTDLGLDFTLNTMLGLHDAGQLATMAPEPEVGEPALVGGSEASPTRPPKASHPRPPSRPVPAKPVPPSPVADPSPDAPDPPAVGTADKLPSVDALPDVLPTKADAIPEEGEP